MKTLHSLGLILFISFLPKAFSVNPEDLYTQEGTDSSPDELIANGLIVLGERWGTGTLLGSTIKVNHELLEQQTGPLPPNTSLLRAHTPTSGSRTDYRNITRWYQLDGNTHIFRLFEGEYNYRLFDNLAHDPEQWFAASTPSRVEGVSHFFHVIQPYNWAEFEVTYTIIKPLQATIFQVFHEGGQLWPFHINMNDAGDIFFQRRRDIPGMPRIITMASNMAGKSIRFKVRANGYDYKLYRKIYNEDDDWVLVTTGYYDQAVGNAVQFRFGIYPGSQPGATRHDAMIFASGATWKMWTPPSPQLLITADTLMGNVVRNPDKDFYDEGEAVVLTPEANPGYRFVNWTGDYEGEENPLTITMNSNMSITANFAAQHTVTISEHTVNGTVEFSPNKPTYDYGETISLTPRPAQGYVFERWSGTGDISSTAVPLNITIDQDIVITAHFRQLTFQLIPSARNGRIIRNPHQGIYAAGTEVELTAMPDEGYRFKSWSGYVTSVENPITIRMDSTIYIIADFEPVTTNIKQTGDIPFSVYPNPSKGIFAVDVVEHASYSVYKLSGIRVKEGEGIGTFHLDLRKYPAGVYLLQIHTKEGVWSKRLLIE